MASKIVQGSWLGQYTASNNAYYAGTGSPIRVGSGSNYQSFIGVPSEVRNLLATSSTACTLKIWLYVVDSAEFDVGAHKETYDKGSGTMPWYTYIGLAPVLTATAWRSIDLTSAFMNSYKNGTYQGLVFYGGADYGEAHGTGANDYYFEVTGDWNDPPPKPTITYPTSNVTIDESIYFTWTRPTDPDGDSLTFEVNIHNGAYWGAVIGVNGLGWSFDTSGFSETSNAQLAVRARDPYGGNSEWTYSQKFTINHNQAPTAPTQLNPNSGELRDRTQNIRLDWQHNDDGVQAGYRIAWKLSGGSWAYVPSSTTFVSSINQYYDVPPNTFPVGDIDWAVMTLDQGNKSSPYSYALLKSSAPSNAPTILKPLNGSNLGLSSVAIEWSSLNQLEYEVLLKSTAGVTLWSVATTGTIKSVTPVYTLENNTTYEAHVRVKDSVSLIWSSYAITSFTTSFTPPAQSRIKKIEEAGTGVANISYGSTNYLVPFGEDYYQVGSGSTYVIDSDFGVTLSGVVQADGIGYSDVDNKFGIVPGKSYKLSGVTDVPGGRVAFFYQKADGSGNGSLGSGSTMALAPAGTISLTVTIPADTAYIRVYIYSTSDNTSPTIVWTDVKLVEVTTVVTNSVDVLRRDFTPTNDAPWLLIGENLAPDGAFLDYTVASDSIYEYMLRARSTNGTSSDSLITSNSVVFDLTFLQLASDPSNIYVFNYMSSRDEDTDVESETMKFAGRKDPVKEFGEHENTTLSIDWEVDSYVDVKRFDSLLKKREVMLYRDGYGRKIWVTVDDLSIKDKMIGGFELSVELTATSYTEDLNEQEEELL